jgi:hypothetical protein
VDHGDADRRSNRFPSLRADSVTTPPTSAALAAGVLVGVIVLVGLGDAAVGWYISGEIIGSMRVAAPTGVEYDTEVVALTGSAITLERPDEAALEADRDAVMGRSWEGGYGRIGPARSFHVGTGVRPFTLLNAALSAVGADQVDVDSFAFPPDPTLVGLDVTTVTHPVRSATTSRGTCLATAAPGS